MIDLSEMKKLPEPPTPTQYNSKSRPHDSDVLSSAASVDGARPPSYVSFQDYRHPSQSASGSLDEISISSTQPEDSSDTSSLQSSARSGRSLVSTMFPQATAGVAGGSSVLIHPSLHLRFTGSKKTILESNVVDQNDRVVYSFLGNAKKTEMLDMEGKMVARMEWHTFGSNVLHYCGNDMKMRDFIPLSKKKKSVR